MVIGVTPSRVWVSRIGRLRVRAHLLVLLNHFRRREVTTISPTPAMTAMAPRIGGTETCSRCWTVAFNGPSSTVSRRLV